MGYGTRLRHREARPISPHPALLPLLLRYAYLDDLWIHGFVSEKAMYPMLEEQMPDVVVHFAQSELNGAVNKGMVKRAGINTVHFPEFFWDVTDTGGWKSGHDAAYEDFYSATPHHPAMITCESKKYEPAKV